MKSDKNILDVVGYDFVSYGVGGDGSRVYDILTYRKWVEGFKFLYKSITIEDGLVLDVDDYLVVHDSHLY